MPEIISPSEQDEQLGMIAPSALAILSQSEHIAMAQAAAMRGQKRNLKEFRNTLHDYACLDQEIAISMFYSLPRAGKQIIGPSVRYAEIVGICWGDCATAARVVGDSPTTVTGQGIFISYRDNYRNAVEVPRRIIDKDGHRYSDDMVITTMNVALSIAKRNAVLKGGVPQALWYPTYLEAQRVAVGDAPSLEKRIAGATEHLFKLGVTEWQILNAVGVSSIKELETEHLATLRVLWAEIKKGDKTIEEVFGSPYDKEIVSLFTQLKMNSAQQSMLRNSYMGRAEKLVQYLRERLGSAAQGKVVTIPEKKPAPAPPQGQEPETPEEPEQPDLVPEPPEEPETEPGVPEEPPDPAPQPEPPLPEPERTHIVMDTPPKRRVGRPTREEALAKRLAEQQASLQQAQQAHREQREQDDSDARQQVEKMIDTMSFDF